MAEAEEERRGMEREVLRSSVEVERLSIESRIFSEIVWTVEVRKHRNKALMFRGHKQGAGVVFVCGQGRYLEGSLVDVDDAADTLRVAVRNDDSSLLAKFATDAGKNTRTSLGVVVGAKLNSVGLERQLEAVDRLSSKMDNERKGARAVRAIILGSSKAAAVAEMAPEWMASPSAVESANRALGQLQNLNPSQKGAIVKALTRRLTLWQGPPGTGKTRTLLGLTYVLTSLRKQRTQMGKILAVAETNAAADNLLAGMDRLGISCVRVGPVSKVRRDLQHRCLEALAEGSTAGRKAAKMRDVSTSLAQEAKTLRDSGILGSLTRAQELEFESQRLWKQSSVELAAAADSVMRDADVVVATCVSSGDVRLKDQEFRVVLVDEATQATQPSTLIALTRGTENVVMAGDDMQLPPTVISNKAQQLGLGLPMFTRMRFMGIQPELLNEQYRMHPDISAFPSRVFYSGMVKTSVSASARPEVRALRTFRSDSTVGADRAGGESEHHGDEDFAVPPVTFLECQGPERRHSGGQQGRGQSYANPSQVEAVVGLVDRVIDGREEDNVKSCAVLTPYNGQLDLLRKAMSDRHAGLLETGWLTLSTVDGFQGREADCVILTTVRSNDEGKLGFVRDPRRMNVAITRAKRALVVVGDRSTLAFDPLWAAWLDAHR